MNNLQRKQMAKFIELVRILERDDECRIDMKDIVKDSRADWVDALYPQPKHSDPLAT